MVLESRKGNFMWPLAHHTIFKIANSPLLFLMSCFWENTIHSYGKSQFLMEKLTINIYKWTFSIATLVITGGYWNSEPATEDILQTLQWLGFELWVPQSAVSCRAMARWSSIPLGPWPAARIGRPAEVKQGEWWFIWDHDFLVVVFRFWIGLNGHSHLFELRIRSIGAPHLGQRVGVGGRALEANLRGFVDNGLADRFWGWLVRI